MKYLYFPQVFTFITTGNLHAVNKTGRCQTPNFQPLYLIPSNVSPLLLALK